MFLLKSFIFPLILTWMLSFTAETQRFSDMTVKVGDDVTLTCGDFKEFNDQCKSTTWIYSTSSAAVTLYEYGKVQRSAGSKSDRLSVTAKCSLVIKKVTVEDEGRYTCRQFNSSGKQVTESGVQLSVTNEKETEPAKTSFTTTTRTTGGTTTTTTTRATTTTTTTRATTTTTRATTTRATTTNPQTSVATTAAKTEDLLLPSLVGAAAGLAALCIITVMIIRWRKTKGNQTQMDDTAELNVIPARTGSGPETCQHMADPDGPHIYASISDTITCNAGVQGQSKDREEHRDIYSLIGAPSAASTDPNNLYSTIQEYR